MSGIDWTRLGLVAGLTVAVNMPFGWWRAGVRKFSLPWFVAVHGPVPLVVALRMGAGLGWRLITFPVLVGAFFGGQLLGGRFRRRANDAGGKPGTRD